MSDRAKMENQCHRRQNCRMLGALTAVALLAAGAQPTPAADDYAATALKVTEDFRAKLQQLAAWCDERGLAEQAAETRDWVKPRDPTRLYISVLPQQIGPPLPPGDASPDVLTWHKSFYQLRREQAGSCYALATKAVRATHASLAFDLVMAALREDPDHKRIREILGFSQYKGQWLTGYEIKRARAGYLWHDRFGWIRRSHVQQYEQGQRFYDGRWITAEQDAQLHADIRNGWLISTEHYNILTNRGIEEAVALGAKLEGLYRVWKQLFIRFYATETQVAGLFEGRAKGLQLPQHNVVYFRDRQEYIAALRPNSPALDISLGIYIQGPTTVSKKSAVYFFAGEDSDQQTLFHEAAHQLFHESRKVSQMVGQACNFWIIEGVAMYFESLNEENGFHVLGGFDAQRILDARYRLLESKFYVPLAEFTTFNITDIQRDPRIGMLYSQAAGLCFFLLHYDNGRYRDAVVAYLNEVYNGRDTVQTLSQLTGQNYQELDRQYAEFMAAGAP